MNYPLVSIITPSYNRANFIEYNINSIMNQTYKNIEHIIVDGGSKDATLEILKKYESKYNMGWISEPDNGMYDAINKGIKMAKGEIIAYLNTDDLYFPWSVEVAVNEFLNSDADLIYGDCLLIDIKKKIVSLYIQPKFNGFDSSCFGGSCLGQPSVFLKKKMFADLGLFDINLKLLADCEYWTRIFFAGKKMKKVDEFLSIIVWHSNNLIFDRDKATKDKEYIKKKYCPDIKNRKVNLYRKYKGQIEYRFQLINFFLSYALKSNKRWKNFIKTIDSLNFIGFLSEFMLNRYKLNREMRYIRFNNDLEKLINRLFNEVK